MLMSVKILEIPASDDDQRLDRWLRRSFPQLTQGRIEKMCRKGEIRINGARCKASSRVKVGQSLRIPPLTNLDSQPQRYHNSMTERDAEAIIRTVIYRDDHIIALNKPAGLATQGGSKQTKHIDGLTEALKFEMDEKPRLVHRLDKETSGVLLLARTRKVAQYLADAFKQKKTRKIYWAAVAGVPTPHSGTINYGLVKSSFKDFEKMRCVHPNDIKKVDGAKHAATEYMVLTQLAKRGSWLAMAPVTGRTHQLRAHIAELGHPIIGDKKYGNMSQQNLGDGWGAQLGGDLSDDLHLHARYLKLEHPVTRKPLEIKADLPDHMARTWKTFEWNGRDFSNDPFLDSLE
jgi:23S rRNA pseudouridine955/2504/2580 synthase